MTRITIDGNICSGKTHYLKLLEKDYKVHHDEPFKKSDITKKFALDSKRYSLGYHLRQLQNCLDSTYKSNEIHIFESSPYSFKNIYGELLLEKGEFDVDEYKIYEKYVDSYGWVPDVIIYLFCNPIVCYERHNLLGSGISLNYIKDLHLRYEIVYDELNCPVKLYKVNSQEDEETVLSNLKDILSRV